MALYFAGMLVIWAALTSSEVNGQGGTQPVVSTQYGRLRGKVIRGRPYTSGPTFAFIGVPYAKPPVGDLRLALPEPVETWEEVRDATEFGAGCPQNEDRIRTGFAPLQIPETELSEDCLYLNVFSPDLNGKRAVFVFIHGGGFTTGKSSGFVADVLASHADIVVVGMNYRLGPLGFLKNFGDGKPWPSNLGQRDQQLALRWVQENIAAFGGDPERVTIGGESAGAISVSAHILSPSSRGLFNRAIAQSGSIFSVVRETSSVFDPLETMGCANLDADATLACMRNKSVDDIVQTNIPGDMLPDGDVVVSDPRQAYDDGKLANVDLLTGVTTNEGFMIVGIAVPEVYSPSPDLQKCQEQLGRFIAAVYGSANAEGIVKGIIDHYFGGEIAGKDPDLVKEKIVTIIGDFILSAPTHLLAQYHSDHVPNTYFYEMNYAPSFLSALRPSWHSGGCDHGYDLFFTFGLALIDGAVAGVNVSEEDVAMSKMAMKYWANFIKTGNPNGDGLAEWKPFNRQDENYVILKPESEEASFYRPEDMAFWNTKIPALATSGGSRLHLTGIFWTVLYSSMSVLTVMAAIV